MDENLRTFLQHHSNMKYSLFLKKLKQSIYTPIAQLNAFVHKSTEPLCFEDMKNERFDNIKIGDSWGGFFDCAWFKFTADIENMQKNLVAVIDVGGEGCIYNKDGEVIQGITNVLGMVDNFQTVKGKAVIPLDRIDTFKDGKVLFYADCGNNGRGGKSSGQARFKRADICVFRQDILDLYYDILACYQLLSAVNDNAQKREIKAHINKAISLAHNTDSQSVLNARNALSKMFDGKYKQNFTVYAVGHGHLDLAWLWPVRETKRKAIRTFSNAVYESEQCPSYVFNGSQPQQYEFIKEISPEFFERIKQSVQRGNIEPQGGMWAESDTNLPCGESLIRQCFYGKKYFREEFQKDVKTLWLPDVFGYTAALPQIIKKCGMDTFMTIKLSWNNINDFPHHTFIWNGLDDSKVLVHMPPEGDYNSNATPYAFEKTYQKYKEKQVSDIALMSFGIGDGGGGPGEYHINMVKRCENLRYIPKVKQVGTKTEQGKYSGKYALTELLVCGECGTPYRRCTWTAKGKKKIVWRCINRLDYGKKYCHHSPSIEESILQNAIMSAVIDTAKLNADILKTLKLHIGMGLDQNDTEDKSLDIQIRIAEIDAEFHKMLKAISADTVESFDETKATELMNEKSRLEQQLAQYAEVQQKRENAKSRLDEIYTILDGLKNHPLTYDDQIIRQILECVVVESKEKIKVVFVGGLKVEQMLN